MSNHWKAKVGSAAFALAVALIVVSPSYGFWFLFGYPHHTNDTSHSGSCCRPDYGYVYHHKNTHDEPFFKEGTSSEHYAVHHTAEAAKRCVRVEEECLGGPAPEQREVQVEKVVVRVQKCGYTRCRSVCHDCCRHRSHRFSGRCGK